LSATATPALEVRALSAGYLRDEPVVRDISLSLAGGSMTALIGPNGAGKSTLIKAMLGLVPFVVAERIAFFGTSLSAARHSVAYIPQRSQIDWNFPASALDIVAMGLYPKLGLFRRVNRDAREQARAALAAVGLADAARAQIGELSGGQQQRVLVARALAQDAQLFLLDEPFANIDAVTETRLAEVLRGLRDRGRTILAVHHDLRSVRTHFDSAILLSRTLVAQGPVADVMTDAMLAQAYGFHAERTA
jgi:manganese/zinc/iron transport system ATP- binding protein